MVQKCCVAVRVWMTCLLIGLGGSGSLVAQSFTVPDAGFEQWTAGTGGQFEEPSSDWWTTLNSLRGLGAPVSVSKSTDSHSGQYAAKMTSAQWNSILIPGLLVSGDFDPFSSTFVITGQPYTGRPSAFKGFYKYYPVNGDSGGVATLLTRWNPTAGKRDTIGMAAMVVYDTAAVYTPFILPFIYFDQGAPDSIVMALVSSQGGQQFLGQAGSTMYADDLALEFATGVQDVSDESVHLSISPNPAHSQFQIHGLMREPVEACLFDLTGKALQSWQFRQYNGQFLPLEMYPAGMYQLQVRVGSGSKARVRFTKLMISGY